MKQVDGIQIGKQIFRYGSKVFITNGGTLLKFTSGADRWVGIFPDCTWDCFYDEVMPMLCGDNVNILASKQRHSIPTIIEGSNIGRCVKCSEDTEYKFCSMTCWFFYTIELTNGIIEDADNIDKIDRNIKFIERMMVLFGNQLNPTQP